VEELEIDLSWVDIVRKLFLDLKKNQVFKNAYKYINN